MNNKYSVAGIELPQKSRASKLSLILGKEIPKYTHEVYRDAAFFGLERVSLFRDAKEEQQLAITTIAGESVLEEAYWIERTGVGYMAKMVLLAETLEERMLYGLFSGDESRHLSQIMRFLPPVTFVPKNSFLRLLAHVVENPHKTVMAFVLQVVLEGWGLTHYRRLAKGCLHQELKETLRGFLADESRHHATGVVLFQEMTISSPSHKTIVEILAQFLDMVRVGPQGIVAAVERVLGHLSPQQKQRVFEELDATTYIGSRLTLLRFLMEKGGGGIIAAELALRGAFQTVSSYQ